MLFMIIYPFVCVPESYLIDNVSVRLGLSLAAGTTIAGAFLKIFNHISYVFTVFGQIFAASFQPAILNSPAKIASVWFKRESRALVTSICVAANTIGVLFGYIFHTFFIDDDDEEDDFRDKYKTYLLWEFIVILILASPTFFLMYNRPSNANSNIEVEKKPLALMENLKSLFQNKNFLKFLVVGSLIVGFFNILGTTLNHYLAVYGISDSEATTAAGVANGVGLVACLIVSMIVDKTKQFRLTMLILNITGLIFMIIITITLDVVEANRGIQAILIYTIVFSTVVPIYSTGMDYVVELTFPVGESYSGGLIMCSNQIVGIVGILVVDALIDNATDAKFLPNFIFCVMFVGSLIAIYFIDEKNIKK